MNRRDIIPFHIIAMHDYYEKPWYCPLLRNFTGKKTYSVSRYRFIAGLTCPSSSLLRLHKYDKRRVERQVIAGGRSYLFPGKPLSHANHCLAVKPIIIVVGGGGGVVLTWH